MFKSTNFQALSITIVENCVFVFFYLSGEKKCWNYLVYFLCFVSFAPFFFLAISSVFLFYPKVFLSGFLLWQPTSVPQLHPSIWQLRTTNSTFRFFVFFTSFVSSFFVWVVSHSLCYFSLHLLFLTLQSRYSVYNTSASRQPSPECFYKHYLYLWTKK